MHNSYTIDSVSLADIEQALEKRKIWDDEQIRQIKKGLAKAILQNEVIAVYEQVTHRPLRMRYDHTINLETGRNYIPATLAPKATTVLRAMFNDRESDRTVLQNILLTNSALDTWLDKRLSDRYQPPVKGQGSTAPPGNVGTREITRLAIQAAWEIEHITSRPASTREVMEQLYKWAEGMEDCLRRADRPKRLVIWQTTKMNEAIFTEEACSKTLVRWRKSIKKSDAT